MIDNEIPLSDAVQTIGRIADEQNRKLDALVALAAALKQDEVKHE